jgi:methyltransferase
MGAARLLELAFSRRNVKQAGPGNEGSRSRRSFGLMVALHTCVIAGTLLFGRRRHAGWLALLSVVQPLRYWALLSLGRNWNARGVVASEMTPVIKGPYAFVRHPNYAVVFVELLALPAAFGVDRRAVIAASAVNVALLTVRIREEEALLSQVPGYDEAFAGKARFIPHLF